MKAIGSLVDGFNIFLFLNYQLNSAIFMEWQLIEK